MTLIIWAWSQRLYQNWHSEHDSFFEKIVCFLTGSIWSYSNNPPYYVVLASDSLLFALSCIHNIDENTVYTMNRWLLHYICCFQISSSGVVSPFPQQYIAAWASPSVASHEYRAMRAVFPSQVIMTYPGYLIYLIFYANWLTRQPKFQSLQKRNSLLEPSVTPFPLIEDDFAANASYRIYMMLAILPMKSYLSLIGCML